MAPCAGLLLVASALAGCATPRVALPDSHLEIPQQWQIAQASERSLDLASYWRLLDDPLLTEFVETAVANNLDLAQSAARLEQARAQLLSRRWFLRDCGIVAAEPEGRKTRYEIADPHLAAALTALVDVTLAVNESAPCLDPACTVPGCCDTKVRAR